MFVDSKHKSALSKYKCVVTERDNHIKELDTKLAAKEDESQTQLNLIEEEVCTDGALYLQSRFINQRHYIEALENWLNLFFLLALL